MDSSYYSFENETQHGAPQEAWEAIHSSLQSLVLKPTSM